MNPSDTLPRAVPRIPDFPEEYITEHFKYSDMLCRGFENDPCRAKPPHLAHMNLELVFRELAEPFTQFLIDCMVRKPPVVAQSYLCPKCLALRDRPWSAHGRGRAVDLIFAAKEHINSFLLFEYALWWSQESGINCKIYPHVLSLHLELDYIIGYL